MHKLHVFGSSTASLYAKAGLFMKSIKINLILKTALPALLVMALVWVLYFYDQAKTRDGVISQAQLSTKSDANAFSQFSIASIKRIDDLLLDIQKQWNGDAESFSQYILYKKAIIKDIAFQVAIADEQGLLVYSNLLTKGQTVDLSDREHFRVHSDRPGEDQLFISKPVLGRVSGKWALQFTRPFFRKGQFSGVIIISISPNYFGSFGEKLDLPGLSELSIIRDSGEREVSFPLDVDSYNQIFKALPVLNRNESLSGNFEAASSYDGIERVYGYYREPQYGFTFLIGKDVNLILAPVFKHRYTMLMVCSFVSILIYSLAFVYYRAIREKQGNFEAIQIIAFCDPITSLPNRLSLLNRLELAIKANEDSKCFGALLYIDLDHFKRLNETLGHEVGDDLLKQVASRLLACIDDTDTVARVGGDEFVVLLVNLPDDVFAASNMAEKVAQKIIASFDAKFKIGIHSIKSSASLGVDLFSGFQGDTSEQTLKHADLAMYAAKTAGRNRVQFYDHAMQALVNHRAVKEAELRIALELEQFCPFYQVQVSHLGKCIGAELLLRIKHPERGFVSIGGYIEVADETGLIVPIGYWALKAACAQLTAWASEPEMKRLILAVNVSAYQFMDPHFAEKIFKILEETGANPNLLKLEITESALLGNVEEAICKISVLRRKGVQFSVDDFGTGYSSLSYLKKLPLDQLKIDQSFVRDIHQDPHACSIVQTIITLAKNLEISIIAEGVETQEQHQFLFSNECLFYQGYLFGYPTPITDFNRLVKSFSASKTSLLAEV